MANFPVAAGHQDYDGLLIPEIWSPRILEKFYEYTVFAEISNTDYEGEIKGMGNKVHIRLRPDIAIRTYVKGQALKVQVPVQTKIELLIDKGQYWNFIVEDVDRAQADLEYMEEWTQDAAEQMKTTIDLDVLGSIITDAATENQGGSAGKRSGNIDLGALSTEVTIDKDSTTNTAVLDYIVDCRTVLDEQNAPESDRWIVLPAWMAGMILKSELKDASLAGDGTSILRNGRVGVIAGFTIYMSNQLTQAGSSFYIPFGHITALTFASQLVESDVLKVESTFGLVARGLNVYGFKINKPDVFGMGVVVRA